MRRPAWTRDTRIERLNRMVMSRLPHWTAEDVARHRAEGERMAARVAELSQPIALDLPRDALGRYWATEPSEPDHTNGSGA
jgi:hypothetical protein